MPQQRHQVLTVLTTALFIGPRTTYSAVLIFWNQKQFSSIQNVSCPKINQNSETNNNPA